MVAGLFSRPADLLKEPQIFIHRRPAQLAHPCQLADIELASNIFRIVPQENCRDVILGHARPANLPALGFGILHAAANTCPDDAQLQLREHRRHLNERLAHGGDLPGAAIDGDRADDY